jgi:hypothetical protein
MRDIIHEAAQQILGKAGGKGNRDEEMLFIP